MATALVVVVAVTAAAIHFGGGESVEEGEARPDRAMAAASGAQPAAEGPAEAPADGFESKASRPTPASVATGDAARRPDPGGAGARFLVRDGSGHPIEKVQIQIVAWTRDLWSHGADGAPPERRLVDESSLRLVTDREGAALCDVAELPVGEYGCVVHASHPGYRVAIRECSPDAVGSLDDQPLVLERAAAPRAIVLGATESDAVVETRLNAPPTSRLADFPRRVHARATFIRSDAVGASLSVDLVAPDDPAPDLDDVAFVRARTGDRLSPWESVAPGETVRLELTPTFVLTGAVANVETIHAGGDLYPAVRCERQVGLDWAGVASAPVRPDGAFGPLRVTLVGEGPYRALLDNGVVMREVVGLGRPEPGDTVDLRFDAVEGGMLHAIAQDAVEGSHLAGARMVASWPTSAGTLRQESFPLEYDGDPTEYHVWWQLPEGVPIAIQAQADGRAPGRLDGIVMPAAAAGSQLVPLRPARRLSGRATGLEPVVRELLLVARDVDGGSAAVDLRVDVDRDGRFVVDAAPAGPIDIVGVAGPALSSAAVRVAPDDDEFTLEFGAIASASGRVVDAETGQPIAGARASLGIAVGEHRIHAIGQDATASADGSFALDLPVGGASEAVAAVVTADGYAPARVAVTAGESASFGTIRLAREGSFTVRLTDGGTPIAHQEVTLFGPSAASMLTTDADGALELPRASDGVRRLAFEGRAGREITVEFPVRAGDPSLSLEVGGTGSIAATVVGIDAAAGEHRLTLFRRAGAIDSWIEVPLSAAGDARLTDLPLGTYHASVHASGVPGLLAEASATLAEGDTHRDLQLAIDADPFHVRVVDPGGAPVEGATVSGTDGTAMYAFAPVGTDADGRAALRNIDPTRFVINVLAPGVGYALGVPASEGEGAEDAPLEIVLGSDASIAARAVRSGEPVEGLTADLVTYGMELPLGGSKRTGPDGLVNWSGLGPGRAVLSFEGLGWFPRAVEVTAGGDGAATDVEVHRRGDLVVTVVRAGEPVEGARVGVRHPAYRHERVEALPWHGVRSIPEGFTTDASGRVELLGLPEGGVTVLIAEGEGEREAAATVMPAARAAVVVDL